MAKTTKCNFCGKELTTGFFSGTASAITLSKLETVTCCDECREQYAAEAARIRKRFTTKVENYKRATKKKLDESALTQMFLTYLQEEKEQLRRCGSIEKREYIGFFTWDGGRRFAIREYDLGADCSAREMLKSLKKADDVGDVWFNKDDITKLEYRTLTFGESLSLFETACSFEIRLNDEKVLTYKPAISKMCFIGKGFFPHTQKKRAKEQCAATLNALKMAIGSDVPVVEVKKFC